MILRGTGFPQRGAVSGVGARGGGSRLCGSLPPSSLALRGEEAVGLLRLVHALLWYSARLKIKVNHLESLIRGFLFPNRFYVE